jgi:outer membrane protein assembly factor BamB
MFRQNPHHTGVLLNADTAPIIPRKLWSYAVPEGIMFSSPIVSNGMVYVGSNFSADCKTPGRVYAFEANTGALVWSFATTGSIGDASPAVIDGTVVIGAGDTVYGFDAMTGLVRWKRIFPGFCFQENFVTAVPELSLVFVGGTLINGQVGYIFSFQSSGAGWFPPYRIDSHGAPSSATFSAPTHILNHGLLVFNAYNKNIHGVNDGDATDRWRNSTPTGGLYATPAYDEVKGRLYTGSLDGAVYALNLNGAVQWSYQTSGRVISSPVVIRTDSANLVIFGSEDGNLYALDENGVLVWKFFAGSAIYSSVAVGGGGSGGQPYLYFATARGNFYVLDIEGKPVTDPNIPAILGNWLTWSSPAIADHRIFIATAGSPSRFFILGDNNLEPTVILTSGDLRSVDVGTFGDMSVSDHLPGVSLWPTGGQWGEPMLVNGRSVRKAAIVAPRFLMNLKNGNSDLTRPFTLKFTYKTNGAAYVYQYDGSQYRLLGKLSGDGTWRVSQVITNPAWYADYQGNPSNGVNVLFKITTTGSEFYLDKGEMIR